MTKTYLVIFWLLISCNFCFAAFRNNDIGTTTAQFLKLGAGARAASLGDAFVGISDDATAVYWNPAGLNKIGNKSVSLMHAIWFEDIFYDWISYVHPLQDMGVFGIGFQYLSYGDIKETDEIGLEVGNFKPNNLAITISYANKVSDILTGLNVKYISSKIKERTSAFAIDVGGSYNLMGDKLTIGLVIQNIGTKMKFVNESDLLPVNIKLGGAYKIESNLIGVLDVNIPIDNIINVGIGTEYNYNYNINDDININKRNDDKIKTLVDPKISDDVNISIRMGYNTKTKDIEGFKGLTLGFGIAYLDYSLDYAFVPFGNLGDTHRVSFGIKF